jgi:signal transduction histidine kinase
VALRVPRKQPAISLAQQPATIRQRRFALAVALLQFVACVLVSPISASVPRIDSFLPAILAIVFLADLITALLLFNQSSATASRALLVLANGYLFSALIVVPHALTFPGAYASKGLLGAGAQSSGWLNVFWHLGFIAAVAGYAWLKDEKRRTDAIPRPALSALYWSAAIQIGLVCALTWAVTAGDRLMPRLFLDDLSYTPLLHYTAGTLVLLSVLSLLLMWIHRKSVLDLWIMVAICMLISEMTLVTSGMTTRFTLGWYVSRGLAVAVSTVVLIALLSESMQLYTALSRAYATLEHERNSKLIGVKAATSSIAHEVGQPLAGIAMNTLAARTSLDKVPPDVDRVKPLLDKVEQASLRAQELLTSIPRMFEDSDQEEQPIDVNRLVIATLHILHRELDGYGVNTDVELAPELPIIMGHRVQLQEVILNLTQNAIDAMAPIDAARRALKVRTKLDRAKAVVIEVEDSGPGIEAEHLDRIFDAFVTTKPKGTGLGLAICSTIIELHGGQLTASSDGKNGTLFRIVLPVNAKGAGRAGRPMSE